MDYSYENRLKNVKVVSWDGFCFPHVLLATSEAAQCLAHAAAHASAPVTTGLSGPTADNSPPLAIRTAYNPRLMRYSTAVPMTAKLSPN